MPVDLSNGYSQHDLDLLISLDPPFDVETLRTRLASLDGHFVIYGHTLYYVQVGLTTFFLA